MLSTAGVRKMMRLLRDHAHTPNFPHASAARQPLPLYSADVDKDMQDSCNITSG